ncbi:MAG: hypothetical protein AAF490_02355 [Chloroflexota bacterium]
MRQIFVLFAALFALSLIGFLRLGSNAQAQESFSISQSSQNGDSYTYHGFLEKDGIPVNNLCHLSVQVEQNDSVIFEFDFDDVVVQDGYFVLQIPIIDRRVYDGNDLLLKFSGSCDGDDSSISFESPITAVPYAYSLRPGAIISGSIGSTILRLTNNAGDGLQINSAGRDGIWVSTPDFDGIQIDAAGDNGVEVNSASGHGVYAESKGALAYGGYFINTTNTDSGYGVYARGNFGASPDLVLGANANTTSGDDGRISSDPSFSGSDIILDAMDRIVLQLDKDNNSSSQLWVWNGDGETILELTESGDLKLSGTLSENALGISPETETAVYGTSSTVSRFEEFGTATMSNGAVTVALPNTFQNLVNNDQYHVFITPLGDCATYVSEKTDTTFSVNAIGGETCTIDFDYRLIGERVDFQAASELEQEETE